MFVVYRVRRRGIWIYKVTWRLSEVLPSELTNVEALVRGPVVTDEPGK